MEENQDPSKRRKLYDMFMAGPSASSSSTNPFKKTTSLSENESYSFILQLGPARPLKHAIGALSDVEINKNGMAMIEFEEKFVDITVRDFRNGTLGFLDLKAEGFKLYCFGTPLRRKMINLFRVFGFLNEASDWDVVTIWHIQESNELWFEFGDGIKPDFKFPVDVLEIDSKFQKAPKTPYYFCELCLSMETLWRFITLQEANPQKLVYFDVSCKEATMTVGGEVMKYTEEGLGIIRGMFSGQKHFAVFHWPYCESLKRASFLAQGFYFYLIRIPSSSIMWKFELEELTGDLVLSTDMGVFKPNTQDGKSATDEMLQLLNKISSLNI